MRLELLSREKEKRERKKTKTNSFHFPPFFLTPPLLYVNCD